MNPTPTGRFEKIKTFIFDIDGVLTDGGLYFSEYPEGHEHACEVDGFRSSGETIKRFNTLDGHGMKLLQQAGITPVIISGRDSAPLRTRLAALGVTHLHLGTEDKRPAAEKTLQVLGLTWQQAAVMGDDWPDLAVMQHCAFVCAPADAHIEIKARAHFTTTARAGAGAAREFCDILLLASGHYARLLANYTQP